MKMRPGLGPGGARRVSARGGGAPALTSGAAASPAARAAASARSRRACHGGSRAAAAPGRPGRCCRCCCRCCCGRRCCPARAASRRRPRVSVRPQGAPGGQSGRGKGVPVPPAARPERRAPDWAAGLRVAPAPRGPSPLGQAKAPRPRGLEAPGRPRTRG